MSKLIPLSEWARRNGVSRMTAWRMATSGELPGARLNPRARWIVEVTDVEADEALESVAYARVSSHDQKSDLDRQIARIAEWSARSGHRIDRYEREVGSGLNDKRRGLTSLLSDPRVGTIVVEHRDRLARFGVAQIEAALKATNRTVIVLDATEVENELVRDMIDLMTSFSARLYGQRSAKNRAKRALEALKS